MVEASRRRLHVVCWLLSSAFARRVKPPSESFFAEFNLYLDLFGLSFRKWGCKTALTDMPNNSLTMCVTVRFSFEVKDIMLSYYLLAYLNIKTGTDT